MAKKILSEAQVRRFGKLGNFKNQWYAKNEEEETVDEGYGMDHKRDDEEVMTRRSRRRSRMDAEMEGGDLPEPEEAELEMMPMVTLISIFLWKMLEY